MKRRLIVCFLFVINVFIFGCGDAPSFTPEEIQAKNEENFTFRKEKLKNIVQIFTLSSQKNLNLYFFSSEEDPFSGKGLLHLSYSQQEDKKQLDVDFQMHYIDKSQNLPFDLQVAGILINSGNQYWMKWNDLQIFMGTGNVNTEILKNIAKEIQGKWIEIDIEEILSILSIPGIDFEMNISQGMSLFTTSYYQLQTGFDEENLQHRVLTEKGEQLQASLEVFILPLLNLLGIPQKSITFDSRNYQGMEYRIPGKKMEIYQNLAIDLDDYVFNLQTVLSPKKIAISGTDFIEKSSIQKVDETFDMVLEQKNENNLILKFFKTLHGEDILKGNLGINLKNDSTMIFQGSFYDKAKELMNHLYLQMNFEGKITFSQFSGEILTPEQSIPLTEILSS